MVVMATRTTATETVAMTGVMIHNNETVTSKLWPTQCRRSSDGGFSLAHAALCSASGPLPVGPFNV